MTSGSLTPRPVALLTDFGQRDPFVGICRGVLLSEHPQTPLIDITHEVPRQDVLAGAVALAEAIAFMPEDCVVLAVVDPGVGSERRALALVCDGGRVLVGPDNGLMAPAAQACGGITSAYEISHSPWRLEPVSSTFHARDIFARVAARIAAGADPADSGDAIEPSEVVDLRFAPPSVNEDGVCAQVLAIDTYGNVRLGATGTDLGELETGAVVAVEGGEQSFEAVLAENYVESEDGEPLLIVDSTGSLSIAVNGGDAAIELGLQRGAEVQILFPTQPDDEQDDE